MKKLKEAARNFVLDESGASVVEYAVLIALIIAVCIVIIGVVGTKVFNSFNDFKTSFSSRL